MSRSIKLRSLVLALVVGLLAGVPAARAATTPEAAAVIDRYVAAIGGRAALAAERSSHTKSKVSAFGFNGTLEAWTERPDRIASRTALGPFTLQDGFDGTTAWRIDQNSKFSLRDGKDLEDQKGSAWFENGRWADPDQGGGAITVLSSEHDSAGAWTVLEVKPPAGRDHALWFNRATGLLDRVVVKADQQTISTRLSDYRLDAGLLRPHRQQASLAGMPANDFIVTTDSIWVNQAIDPSLFAPPEHAASDVKYLGHSSPARLPMRYAERHIWVKASINNGPPGDFLLDTGASVSLLDSAWAAAHHIAVEGRMQAMGAGAAGEASFARISSTKVLGADGAGVEISGQKVAVLALNRFIAPFFWHDAAGVLGYDFISRFVVEIDYDRDSLTLHDPKTFAYAGRGTGIPITLSGGIPVVKAKLDGEYEGQFRIDVGSSSTVDLHGPFVTRHDLRKKQLKTIEVLNGGFGGTFSSSLTRMRKMEIGPFAWRDPLVILSGATTGGLASEDYAGNVGNEVLDRFKCTLDYDHRTLYLEPGRQYAKLDRFTRAGVQLARYGDQVRAMQVLAGSAADAAGIRMGDEVLTLDGKSILTFTQDVLSDMFENGAKGEKHVLALLRDGKRITATLRLKEII